MVQNFKEVMITLPLIEKITPMAENRKLYSEMNQMREKKQNHTQNIEMLHGEVYKVIIELAYVQCMVKRVVQEHVEKLKTHITVEMTEGIA
jgi:hypothetical protein